MNTSRTLDNFDSAESHSGRPACFDKGFKESILNVYWSKQSKTWVYLSACSQTSNLGHCLLEEKLDLICDQLRILLLEANPNIIEFGTHLKAVKLLSNSCTASIWKYTHCDLSLVCLVMSMPIIEKLTAGVGTAVNQKAWSIMYNKTSHDATINDKMLVILCTPVWQRTVTFEKYSIFWSQPNVSLCKYIK